MQNQGDIFRVNFNQDIIVYKIQSTGCISQANKRINYQQVNKGTENPIVLERLCDRQIYLWEAGQKFSNIIKVREEVYICLLTTWPIRLLQQNSLHYQ